MEFTFKLSEQEAQKVLDALVKQPYGEVVDVINNIQQQAFEQREERNKQAEIRELQYKILKEKAEENGVQVDE